MMTNTIQIVKIYDVVRDFNADLKPFWNWNSVRNVYYLFILLKITHYTLKEVFNYYLILVKQELECLI